MEPDEGEPVEPWLLHHLHRVQRWRRGTISHWGCRHVTLGVLPDGRWLTEHSGDREGTRLYRTEAAARNAAVRLMAADDAEPWVEVPAQFDSAGQPTTPGWVRRGGTWMRNGG